MLFKRKKDNNIDTGENNNKRSNEVNNLDSQSHDNGKKITKLNNYTIKNMYDHGRILTCN